MSVESTDIPVHDDVTGWFERADYPDEEYAAGDGGGEMDIFASSDDIMMDALFQPGYHPDTQQQSEKNLLPSAVMSQGDPNESELAFGVAVSGDAVDADRNPIEGRASLIYGDKAYSMTVRGRFTLSTPPNEYVTSGENQEEFHDYDFLYSPDDGLPQVEQSITSGDKYTFTFHELTGRVVDSEGNPVADDTVFAGGQTFTTDNQGEYRILETDGTQLELGVLKQSEVQPVTVGSDDEVVSQYGGVQVNVVSPDGDPMEGVPVEIRGEVYKTDESGQVYHKEMPVGSFGVTVMDIYELVAEVNSQGYVDTINVGEDSDDTDYSFVGLTIVCRDGESRRPIKDTPVRASELNTRTESAGNGLANLLVDKEAGDVSVRVADGDPRYETTILQLDNDEYDLNSLSFEFELSPKTYTINS